MKGHQMKGQQGVGAIGSQGSHNQPRATDAPIRDGPPPPLLPGLSTGGRAGTGVCSFTFTVDANHPKPDNVGDADGGW
jgi:hypothetical protein